MTVVDRAIVLASVLKEREQMRHAIVDQRARKQMHMKLNVFHFHSITFVATLKTKELC